MKSIRVYVITTPEDRTNKVLVRTKPGKRWYAEHEHEGYKIIDAEMTWKAQRAIARKYLEAGGTL